MEVVRRARPDVVMSARIGDTYEALARLKLAGYTTRLAVAVRGFEAQYVQDVSRYREFIDGCFVDGKLIQRACIDLAAMEADRVHELPAGVLEPLVPPRPRVPGKVLRIGYVGRLSQADKRVLDLIPLVRNLHESRLRFALDIVGTGPEEATLKAALSEFNDCVRFHGWISRKELYENVFPALDCVLNFSPTEGVTIAPREALIHGAVCVLSRFPGLQSEGLFVHGYNALLFPTGDTKTAALHLVSLHRNHGLLERLSTNAMQTQSGKYTYAGSIEAWAHALDRSVAMPVKLNQYFNFDTRPAGRLEAWGVPSVLADPFRSFFGRQAIPLDPGDEWPHGSVALPDGAQRKLEAWAGGLESDMSN
jgi:glycosyltransferase involved in cell wall biosynthesis